MSLDVHLSQKTSEMAEARQEPQESSDSRLEDLSVGLAVILGWEETAKRGRGKLSRHREDLLWAQGWEPEEMRIRGNCCSWRCSSS